MNVPKTILTAFFPIFFLAGITESQAQNFEGVIHYEFPENQTGQMGEMKYMIKGSKVRMNMGEGQQSAAMIYFTDKSEMIMLIDQMKGYMKTDTDASQNAGLPNQQRSSGQSVDEWDESQMQQTGETKAIAGRSCEVWKVNNEDGKSYTLCMAKGMGSFMAPGNPLAKQNAPSWARKIMKEGFMPLEVIDTSGGEQSVQMRATKIEEKSLDASLFEVPDDYRDVSSMMQQGQSQNRN